MELKASGKFANGITGELREGSFSGREQWTGATLQEAEKEELSGQLFWEKRKTSVYLEDERQEPVEMPDARRIKWLE